MSTTDPSEFDTPTDLPPHPDNVAYVRALGALTLQLSALNGNLSTIMHEVRVAREPVGGTGIVGKLREAFTTLKNIATEGETAFDK